MLNIFLLIGGAFSCPINEHHISSLPFAEPGVHACQYAGTFQTALTAEQDHNLFYWFFRNANPSAPLILWLNGGPGASSMMGTFLENGPLRVSDGKILPANQSWADDYNMIYLDQPVGTGFSYGNSHLTEMQDGSKEFIKFFEQFYELYPDLKANELYLTGESYGGKYLPLFSHDILESTDFNLVATMISDPLPSPMYERTEMHVLPEAHGIIDDKNLDQMALLEQKCWNDFTEDIAKGSGTCASVMTYVKNVSAGVAWYDSRIFGYDFKPEETEVATMLNKKQILKALHLQNSTRKPKFGFSSTGVKDAYKMDHLKDYSSYYNYLIERGYPLIVMVGEFDMQDGYKSQIKWMKNLLNVSFWAEARKVYYHSISQVGGYYLQENNFTFIVVPKSGHFMPRGNYGASKAFLDDFVQGKQLKCRDPTGEECSVATKMCAAMNNCNGHPCK